MTALRITILHDCAPGHLNQSRGLAKIIASQQEVDVRECAAQLSWPLSRKLLSQLCQAPLPLLRKTVINAYKMEYIRPDTDLLISFGGKVAPLNVALAKDLHCRNILIGSLRGINPRHASAHLSLKGGEHHNAIATGIAPTTISPEQCNLAGTTLKQRLGNGRFWSCLIGGKGSGYQYCENDWRELADGMNHLAAQHGIQWLIATSRRTGAKTEDFLQRQLDAIHVAHSSFYSLTGEDDITAMLGCSERVFCTADSLTMLSEAISSGRPTIGLQPKYCTPPAAHQSAQQSFCEQDYLQLTNISDMDNWEPAANDCRLDYASYRNRIIEPLQQWAVF